MERKGGYREEKAHLYTQVWRKKMGIGLGREETIT